jgi:hypothetical protein
MSRTYKLFLCLLLIAVSSAFSQINLHTQSRNVDFTNAPFTRPFKAGTTLSTACSAGDAFLKTDAPPGQNLYVCTNPGNPGTWTVQGSQSTTDSGGSGSGVSDISNLRDFTVSLNGASVTIGCPSRLCQVRIGEKVYQFAADAIVSGLTGTGGSSTVYVYIDESGVLNCGYDGLVVTGATLSGLTGVTYVTNVPANAIPLAHCAVASNRFVSCSDDRALLSRTVIDQGTGITIIQNPTTGHTTVAANPTTLPFLGLQNTFSGALNDFSASQVRLTTGAGVPSSATCGSASNVGYVYIRNDAKAANSSHYICSQTGAGVYSWELTQGASGGGGGGVSGAGAANNLAKFSGSSAIGNSGISDDGTTVSTTEAINFRAAAHTSPSRTGTIGAMPGTCSQGEEYFATDAAPGRNKYYCTAANIWTQQSGSSGGGGGVTVSGPYLTDGTNYWIQGTGELAKLFNNAGFAFTDSSGQTFSSSAGVGTIVAPSGSPSSDHYSVNISGKSTVIATVRGMGSSISGSYGSTFGVVLKGAQGSIDCGVDTTTSGAFISRMNIFDGSGNYARTDGSGAWTASSPLTIKIVYASGASTCSLSNDGGAHYILIGTDTIFTTPPTQAQLMLGSSPMGAYLDILSWSTL